MERILFLAHTESDGSLHKSASETLAAVIEVASGLGCPFDVAVFGENAATAIDAFGGCGAAAFYTITGGDFSTPRYGTDVAAVQALVEKSGANIVVATADSRISRVIAGAAQRLGGRADTFATKLEAKDGALVISRWYYRQRMVGALTRAQRPWLVSMAPGSHTPYAGEAAAASAEEVAPTLPDNAKRTQVHGIQTSDVDEQTIRPDAEMLFVAGAGWTKKQSDGQIHGEDASSIILDFLGTAKASLGSSKSLVDQGTEGQPVLPFLTHLHQVGQTGATPRHPKGLATCCHGEEPHVVGWRFINERRAINLDASCGWAQGKADVLYVADAFAVIQKVNELLKS